MYYLWLVPSVILWYAIYTWISKLNNDHKSTSIFVLLCLLGACPFWPLATRFSKNLIFDGILYDILMSLTYVITMIILGAGSNFSVCNWIGVVIVIIGFFLIKI